MRCFDASTRTDLPIPEVLPDLVAHLTSRCSGVVVIGAVARDILAVAAGGLTPQRATRDIDVAIAVDSYGAYDQLDFDIAEEGLPCCRFRGMAVDVLPFGAIEQDRIVRFKNEHELDVTGLAEACRHAVDVVLPGGAAVPVASIESQSVLKLLAWRDRGSAHENKDALDMRTLLLAASSGVYEARLYEDEALELNDFDISSAGAYCLGRDAAAGLGERARCDVHDVVDHSDKRRRLARAMKGQTSLGLVEAYVAGFCSA